MEKLDAKDLPYGRALMLIHFINHCDSISLLIICYHFSYCIFQVFYIDLFLSMRFLREGRAAGVHAAGGAQHAAHAPARARAGRADRTGDQAAAVEDREERRLGEERVSDSD